MSLELLPRYTVNLVTGSYSQPLPMFSYAAGVFTALPSNAGRITMDTDGAGTTTFSIDGKPVFYFDTSGAVALGWVTDKIYPKDWPRIEFVRKVASVPISFAAISNRGIGSFRSIFEQAIPAGADRIILNSKVSIGVEGLYCDSISEIPALSSAAGRYIATYTGKVIAL
jgi:hypothetical protein